MKQASTIFAALVLLVSTGCQSVPPPVPGMATLRVSVIAEPKTGFVTGNTHVRPYDMPTVPAAWNEQFERVDYASLENIVVWLQPGDAAATKPSAVRTLALDVDAGQPDGKIRAASVGEIITFHNSASMRTNLYSVSDGNEFDLGSVPSSGNGVYVVKSEGLIEVLTDSMKDPIAQVYAVPSKWVRVAHAGETVLFENVPPGSYRIISWHPRLPGQATAVTLSADQVASATVKVGVNDLPKVGER